MALPAILLPDDPQAAQAIRAWAAEKGLEFRFVEKNGGNRRLAYPRTCKHGHSIQSEADELVQHCKDRIYRYCRQCRRIATRKQKKKDRERKRNERAAAEVGA